MGSRLVFLACFLLLVLVVREVSARGNHIQVKGGSLRKRGSRRENKQGSAFEERRFSPIDGDDEDFLVVAASGKGEESFFSKDSTKGLLCILGGALMHITLGTLYCWGNFMSYAPESLKFFDGAKHPGVSPDALLIMPATLASQCLTMPFGAQLAAKYGSRATMMLGAIIVSAGVFLSSYATSLTSFLMLYAVMFGAGIGLSYTSPMIAGWKWMPDKKGLVSGAILTGFGAGGFFFNIIGTKLVNPRALNPVDGVFPDEVYNNFPSMLRKLGALYLIGGFAGSMLVTEPAKPAGGSKAAAPAVGTGIKESLTTKQFWLMWTMIVCSASAGLNVAAIYKQFAASSPALTGDSFQALVGGLGALFNGVGRLFWGQISDSIGFKKSFMGLTLFQAMLHAYYPFSGGSKFTFAAATCLCFFFLAGNFALMPPAIQKMFGPKNGALIYGLVYSAFGVASIGGMILGKSLKAQFGLEGVFRVLSAMSVVGALLTSRLQPLASLPSSTV